MIIGCRYKFASYIFHNYLEKMGKHKNTMNEQNEFKFPPEWKDKFQMTVMFSNFHARNIDTEAYDTKLIFWMNLIKQYCTFLGKANFCLRELQLQFIRKDRIPACLDVVIKEMSQRKLIRLRKEYEYDPLNTWTGWFVNKFVKLPLSRSWLKIKQRIFDLDVDFDVYEDWIHLEVLHNICCEMETKVLSKNRGRILNFEDFWKVCYLSGMRIHDDFLEICLLDLEASHQVALQHRIEKKISCIQLIKIPSDGNNSLEITESDLALYNLEITQSNLLEQVESIEENIKVIDEKCRQYLQENKRQLAKSYLRKRRLLENSHEKRSLALHNIETLLANVEDARNNGVVLDAYKIGAKALQKVLHDSGLKYENVDGVLADVRDTLDQHREIEDIMSNTTNESINEEEEQLEIELNKLMGVKATTKLINATTNNNKPEIVIEDEDLIAKIESLEVEDGSLSQIRQTTMDSL